MAALRTFVLDTCTVATYLLGEGIDSRVLHLREFSTLFYSILIYFSAILRIWFDNSTESVCSHTVATAVLNKLD